MATKHPTRSERLPARPARRVRGLTLVEMAVVLAIAAIVAASALPDFGAQLAMRRLQGAAGNLAADLQLARSEALARNRTLRFSVRSHAEASCWIVHTGAAGDCDCASDGGIVCAPGATAIRSAVLPAADRIAVAGNVASIVFDPLPGTSTPPGTLRVVDARGRAVHHVVNVLGRVRSCSPAGAVGGYPAC